MYLYCFYRDLFDMDTPLHSWKREEPFRTGDYYEASGFSTVAEVVPTNIVSMA